MSGETSTEDEISLSLLIAVGCGVLWVIFSFLHSRVLMIEPLNVSIPLIPVVITALLLLFLTGSVLYFTHSIIISRLTFRIKHPNTSLKGAIYLVPGINCPYQDLIDDLNDQG